MISTFLPSRNLTGNSSRVHIESTGISEREMKWVLSGGGGRV